MPEGPEIRRAADKIASVLVGYKTTRVEFSSDDLKQFEKILIGRSVTGVETRGKAMLTCFDHDWVIYSHNQLYGRWYLDKPGQRPDVNRQLRLTIETANDAALLYSASSINVLKKEALHEHTFLAKLGPDILSEQPTVDEIVERLRSKPFRKRQLAALLLDQGFLAGMGTYLCAEILLYAKLHPKAKAANCSLAELKHLAKGIVTITERSYRTGGIANTPALVKALKSQGKLDKEQHRFSAYRREGEPCYYCDRVIERSDIGGRPMFSCPGCQPKPSAQP